VIIRRTVILLCFLTTLFSLSKAQEIEVTAAFDSTRIYIGDQINYTVTVTQPSDVRLNVQQLKDTLCRNIEIVSGPFTDSIIMQDNMLKTVNRYLVTSFDSGFYEAPPVYAELKSETGIRRFYSEYSPLEVMRVQITPPDSAEIFDIIEPYGAPVTLGEILPWALLVIIIAVVIWGIVRIIRKYRKTKEEPEVMVNSDPAHVIAFRDLEKLREEQLWQKGEVKLYYSRLTEILRQYLEDRYGVYSLEMTTTETLSALLKTGFKKNGLYTSLKTILEGSDLVKFAKYKPDPVENDVHFQNSWAFIEATMEKEEVIDSEKADETKNKV
jgi:uncharacterized repeat protein (TIGR01451 family)